MSKTVRGRVQRVHDKQDNDWFGICIDDTWYNGDGSLSQDVDGFKLEIEYEDNDNGNSIQKINVLEEDNEDVQSERDRSYVPEKEGSSDSSNKTSSTRKSPKRANIMATAATKKAADIVAEQYELGELEQGEFEELTSTVATGLNNVMNKLYEENMQ